MRMACLKDAGCSIGSEKPLAIDTRAIRDPDTISSLFSGKGATLTVVHKNKDGVTTLAVHGYAPAKGHL